MLINTQTQFGAQPNVLLYAKSHLTFKRATPEPVQQAHHKVGSLVDILILDQDRVVVLKNRI